MPAPREPDVPADVLSAMSLAQSIAREHAREGGDLAELLGAYAGLVATMDTKIAADCLIAIEGAVRKDER